MRAYGMTVKQYKKRMQETAAAFRQHRAGGGEEVAHDFLYLNDRELFREWQARTQQSFTTGAFFNPASSRRN